jgi:ribokinase
MKLRLAVIGHVEHATIGRLATLPAASEIAHVRDAGWIPGGGGGIAFHQLTRSTAEVHFFTAVGSDEAGQQVAREIDRTGAHIHAARRDEPHTRDLIIITPDGQRTIFVVGPPLHPRREDPLPWDVLATCDGAYFTGQDPATLLAAREARVLVVTGRRSEALAASGVRADVIVGSLNDPREAARLTDFAVPPAALVMTDGERGGRIETADGIVRFPAGPTPEHIISSYGAGDTFAGALTWYAARGLPLEEACARASEHAAAVLRTLDPLSGQTPLTD